MQELDRFTGRGGATRERVHRAILKLTDGSFEDLKRLVDLALTDYRDVIAPAEYPDYHKELVRQFGPQTKPKP